MDAHDRKWFAWLAGFLVVFGVMETKALRSREPGKPTGTLTASFRKWLGTDPKHWRRHGTVPLFFLLLIYLAGHFCFGLWNS